MIRTTLLLMIALLVVSGNASAQNAPALPKDAVEKIARAAHEALPNAKVSDGTLIGPDKAKTLQYPLIPYELIEFIVLRGHLAGFAAHCGLDWENRFFLPFMSFLRGREKSFTDYQWAYVGVLHGFSMNAAEGAIEGQPCTPDMKANLEKEAK